jgi:uncharacterized protein with HEPN domain
MRRDVLFLREMISAGYRIVELVQGVELDDLQNDRGRLESLLWNFTVLGEASGQVSTELKSRFPGVEWRRPTQLRNRVVHAYWSVDAEVLHTTARDLMPTFLQELEAVLSQLADEEDPEILR